MAKLLHKKITHLDNTITGIAELFFKSDPKGRNVAEVAAFPVTTKSVSYYKSDALTASLDLCRDITQTSINMHVFTNLAVENMSALAVDLGVFEGTKVNFDRKKHLEFVQLYDLETRKEVEHIVNTYFYMPTEHKMFIPNGSRTTAVYTVNYHNHLQQFASLFYVKDKPFSEKEISVVLANLCLIWITILYERLDKSLTPFKSFSQDIGSLTNISSALFQSKHLTPSTHQT
jgi:hypothetical protein